MTTAGSRPDGHRHLRPGRLPTDKPDAELSRPGWQRIPCGPCRALAKVSSQPLLFRGDDFANGRLYQSREDAVEASALRRQQMREKGWNDKEPRGALGLPERKEIEQRRCDSQDGHE